MKSLILLTLILAGLNAFAENSKQDNVDFSCPDNYVRVPALIGYTKNDFCVMKYEAKSDGFDNAISQASGKPYVNINRDDSTDKCTSLGEGYDLITNDEWQSIARNIELVPENWAEVLKGGREDLNRGHSDNSPFNALAAISDDTKGCKGTEQTCSNTTWDGQRRTHTLSNGEVIWDVAGNVWEWVKEEKYDYICSVPEALDNPMSTPMLILSSNNMQECFKISSNGTTTTIRTTRDQFGPSRNYMIFLEILKIQTSPFVNPDFLYFHPNKRGFRNWRGFGFRYLNGGREKGVYRGGSWFSFYGAGVFAVNLGVPPVHTAMDLGFRCVFHP